MRSFSFPLQQLLDLRSRAQDEAQRSLADSQREALCERERLECLSAACATVSEATAAQPGEALQPGILLNNGLHLIHLRAKAVHQTARVQQSSQQEQTRRLQLLAAAQQREVLERLKQRRYDLHLANEARVESRELDESAAITFVRQRNSI